MEDPSAATGRRRPAWLLPALTFAAVAALFAWAFWQRYRLLQTSPYPVGIDGYFYPIQLRSLLESGTLYYPSAPFLFWFMTPLAAATDPITGAKLGAALGGALAVFPVHVLGRQIGGSRAAGILAALLVATSAESFYLTTEFVKNGFGLTVAAVYLCALLRALQRPSRARTAVALLLLVATFATHKLAVAFALVATIPPLWGAWRMSDIRPEPRRLAAVAAAGLAVVVLAGVLAPRRFLSWADVTLFERLFTARADLSLPVLRLFDDRSLSFDNEVAVGAVLALIAFAACFAARRLSWLRPGAGDDHRDDHRLARSTVLGPAFLAVCIAIPYLDVSDPQGLAFRLRLIAFLPMALCAAFVVGLLFRHVAPPWRVAMVAPLAVAFVLLRPAAPDEGIVRVHPAMHAAVRALDGHVPADDVIIVPERHILFMAAWYTRTEVRLRPEEIEPARRWRLVPMALMSPELRDAIDHARAEGPRPRPLGLHPRHRNGLVLMPETTWEWILQRLPPGQQDHYRNWMTI